jgi:hypothetical protein
LGWNENGLTGEGCMGMFTRVGVERFFTYTSR